MRLVLLIVLSTFLVFQGVVPAVAQNQVQIRGGTAAGIAAITPAAREILYDTTNDRIVLGDGVTLGGVATIINSTAIAAAYQPLDADLTAIAALTTTAFGRGLLDDADGAAARTTIGAVIGTDVQAFDTDLGVIAGLADPNADRILFWDDSAGAYAYLTAGTGLTITGTTIEAAAGGGDALTTNPLSQFAATTSLQLLGVISDETGTGALAFANTPTLVTPVLGVATATSINKVALTAPATASTLTIADGKTLTASNTVTFTATDGSTLAIGTGGTLGTAAYTASTAYVPSIADPNADRVLFWDDSAGAYAYLTMGTNLTITGTTLDAAGGGASALDDLSDVTITSVARGNLLIRDATDWKNVAVGTAGYILKSDGTDAAWGNTFARGTITTSDPWTFTQTFNSGGVTFKGMVINITNTASAAASTVFETQVGGTTRFSVRASDGFTKVTTNDPNIPGYLVVAGGANQVMLGTGNAAWPQAAIASNGFYSWSTTTDATSGSYDVSLYRDAANTLAIRNGTAAQTANIYGTFTNSTNRCYGSLVGSATAFTITAKTEGTCADDQNLVLAGSGVGIVSSTSTFKAAGYQSSDGSAGVTVTTCTAFKNGLCTAGT